MKLRFLINPYYLLLHSIQKARKGKPFPAWSKLVKENDTASQLLRDPLQAMTVVKNKREFRRIFQMTEKRINRLLTTQEFRRILKETEHYQEWVETEWKKNADRVLQTLSDITGLSFPDQTMTVFMTHPTLSNGMNIPEQRVICWGHSEDWRHYTVVYLCHEMLHIFAHRKYTDEHVMHAIIELAVDNELRIRLNGRGQYFQEGRYVVGHPALYKLEKRLLPFWKKYLKGKLKVKNLISFERWVTALPLSRKNHRSSR